MPTPGQYFVEFEIRTTGHAEVNAALLATARAAFPDEPVRFAGARAHVLAVEAILEAHRVEGIELEIVDALGSEPGMNLLAERRLFGSLRRLLRKGGVRRLTVCSTSRRRLGWILRLARSCPGVEVVVVLHETSYVLGLAEEGLTGRLAARFLHRDLPPNSSLLILDPRVARETADRYPFAERSLAWMWHPCFRPPTGPDRRSLTDRPLEFVFFGVAKPMKGIEHFLRLARRIHERYGRDRARFSILGRVVPGSFDIPEGSPVEHLGRDGELARSEIERRGRLAHWAVMPYASGSYRYRSSGSIHDALTAGVPILGSTGPPLEAYFESFGPLGELFGSYEDLEAAVERILTAPRRDLYDLYVETIRRAVSDLQPESLAPFFAQAGRL